VGHDQRSSVVVHQRQQVVYTQTWKGGASMSTKRITVSVNAETVEKLRQLQAELKAVMGVDFSVSQAIDYLVAQYRKENNND
jgi:hypothetical protein